MNDPALYHKAEFLKSDIKNFFNEHKKAIHFRRDGCDSLLDIGCASGHITVDVISPLLPETFSRVIGVDINERMVCYANDLFKSSKIFFEILDIGGDVTEFLSVHGCFDHITSSLCLHLLPDQVTTLKNISNLLHPNGDCLLYILVECFIFDVYVKMDKKWLKYMEDLDDYISPYYRKVNPEYLLRRNMRSAGFTQCEVKLRHQSLVFDNIQKFRDSYQSVIPFYHRIPSAEREEFMQEFTKLAMELTGNTDPMNETSGQITIPYVLMTAFATKN